MSDYILDTIIYPSLFGAGMGVITYSAVYGVISAGFYLRQKYTGNKMPVFKSKIGDTFEMMSLKGLKNTCAFGYLMGACTYGLMLPVSYALSSSNEYKSKAEQDTLHSYTPAPLKDLIYVHKAFYMASHIVISTGLYIINKITNKEIPLYETDSGYKLGLMAPELLFASGAVGGLTGVFFWMVRSILLYDEEYSSGW